MHQDTIVDAMGFAISSASRPMRIVSLVPSETEAVAQLGAGDRLVGRTDYCVHPANLLSNVPSVGGTKDASIDAIVALRPDVVLCNQEENTPHIVESLRARGITVHVSFPKSVDEAAALLDDLAVILHADALGLAALCEMHVALSALRERRASAVPTRVFCPIWMDPLMTIHGETFMSDALDLAGAYNVFSDRPRRYPLAADLGLRAPLDNARVQGRDTRYPRVTHEELIARAPQLIVLPDEPHPFSAQDAEVFTNLGIENCAVLHVMGRDLCWYSLSMASGISAISQVIRDHR
ncbi:MAG: helical backbone metal receptor [Deltaproteobacteria bacterium]|nr:helical backbone metal receptor [Deltaproteobacteria bacterium]